MGDKKTEPHPSGFEVVTPRGVQQWVGDSAGSASRAPGAFGSILGDVEDDHVRVHRDVEERSRVTHASHVDDDEASSREDIKTERVPQRITYKIPSTFNLGQALLWTSVSIGGHLSREHLEREIERWWSYNPKAEPPLALVSSRLSYAHLDPLSVDQQPIFSAEVTFKEAGDQLLDALRGGRVKLWGEPSDPRNSAEFLSPYQCEQIFFSEEQYGAVRAVTINKPERFWTCLRFVSSEIVDLWPVSEGMTIDDSQEGVGRLIQEEVAAKANNGDKVGCDSTISASSLISTEANSVDSSPDVQHSAEVGQGLPYHTGLAGRPTSLGLISDKLKSRARDGVLLSSLAKEAEYLEEWLTSAHPTAPSCRKKAIANGVRDLYRNLKSAPKIIGGR